MEITKTKAIELIERKIAQFKEIKDHINPDNTFDSAYEQAYHGTIQLLADLFSVDEKEYFRVAVHIYSWPSNDSARQVIEYRRHIDKCISQLEIYTEKIENFWGMPHNASKQTGASPNQRRTAELSTMQENCLWATKFTTRLVIYQTLVGRCS